MASSTTTTTTSTTSTSTTTTSTTGIEGHVGTVKESTAVHIASVNFNVGTLKHTRPPGALVGAAGGDAHHEGILTRLHPPVVHVNSSVGFNPYADQWAFGVVFDPYNIDCGFIVEDVDYEITIWNQNKTVSITITDIIITSSDGLTLDKSAPIVIPPYAEEIITLTVYRDGPAFQSSFITFTIDAVDYVTNITGLRILMFPAAINWEKGYTLDYVFRTVYQTNKKFYEQRRPLTVDPRRSCGFSVWEEGLKFQYIRNLLKYGHDKFFLVPIFSEVMYTDRVHDITGQDHVNIDTGINIDYFYNLQNYSNYIMIVDHITFVAEVKSISSIVGQIITFTSAVTETFVKESALVYPVIVSIIDSTNYKPMTDDLTVIDLKFIEWVKSDR